jgi:hypothetical protein
MSFKEMQESHFFHRRPNSLLLSWLNTGCVTQASDQALLRDLALLKPDERVAKKARVERQVPLPAAVGPAREGEAFPPYGEAKSGEGKVRAPVMAC